MLGKIRLDHLSWLNGLNPVRQEVTGLLTWMHGWAVLVNIPNQMFGILSADHAVNGVNMMLYW